jgi:hypothetical protein
MRGGPRKLTEVDVRAIFTRTRVLHYHCSKRFHGCLLRQLAAQFSVTVKTIRDVSQGKTWPHITHYMSTSPVDELLSRNMAMQGEDPFADDMAKMYEPYQCENPF